MQRDFQEANYFQIEQVANYIKAIVKLHMKFYTYFHNSCLVTFALFLGLQKNNIKDFDFQHQQQKIYTTPISFCDSARTITLRF